MNQTEYDHHKPMLHSLTKRQHQKSGIEFDELFSEACLIFAECGQTHNPDLSKFSTWVYQKVHFGLMDYCQKTKEKNADIGFSSEFLEHLIPINYGEPWIDFRSGFSHGAQDALDLIVQYPDELIDKVSDRRGIRMRWFAEWLHNEHGYKWREAEEIWREIKGRLHS